MCGIIAYINSSIDCYNIIYNGLKQLQKKYNKKNKNKIIKWS